MTQERRTEIFERWLAEHKGLLFKVVRAYAFTVSDQDDLFQEIAFQVWNSIPNYNQQVAETTWIYRVALYTAIGWTRKERRHRSRKSSLAGTEHLLVQASEDRDPRLDWLYDQIAKLDELDRSVTLLLLEGFSYSEMAETLGITQSNLGVRINRIKKRLIGRVTQEVHDGL